MPLPSLVRRLVKGSPLTKQDHDDNIDNLDGRLIELESAESEMIDDIVQNVDGSLTIIMSDYRTFGPFPMPIAIYNPRGLWQPSTIYSPLDLFHESGAVYVANKAHTSALTFDPGAQEGGEDLYAELIPRLSQVPVPQEVSSDTVILGLSMVDKWSYLTSPTGTNIIIPKDSTVNHAVGAECHVFSTVFGVNVTFEPEDGTVTVLWDEECIPQLSGRYVAATFKKVAANLWHVVGSLALDPSA